MVVAGGRVDQNAPLYGLPRRFPARPVPEVPPGRESSAVSPLVHGPRAATTASRLRAYSRRMRLRCRSRSPRSIMIATARWTRPRGAVGQFSCAACAMRSEQQGARDQPADPDVGAERLRQRAEQDDAFGVEAVEGRERGDVVAELGVVVVLDDDRAVARRPGQQAFPARDRQAGRRSGTGGRAWCRSSAGRRAGRRRSRRRRRPGQGTISAPLPARIQRAAR